ncbi:hypothetical protein [uncultured Paraglaciecola sp.]|uniref:hypothetical protein n=1 Tax=uncultured Paraglaciecola sp. TaxID=1765024 RepID=UPI002624B3B7|nr:hypothetical protein [uncultured Paraglaciecola sp.]
MAEYTDTKRLGFFSSRDFEAYKMSELRHDATAGAFRFVLTLWDNNTGLPTEYEYEIGKERERIEDVGRNMIDDHKKQYVRWSKANAIEYADQHSHAVSALETLLQRIDE